MIASGGICSIVHFVALIGERTARIIENMAKVSQNTRIKDMGKPDKLRIAKRSRDTQEMSDDRLTKASLRKAKVKERQSGRKQIKQELKD